MKCSVKFCNNYGEKNSNLSFFRFPANQKLAKVWVEFCQRDKEFKTSNACICMEHFDANCIENEVKFKLGYARNRILKPGSVPTKFLTQGASRQPEAETTSTHDEYEDQRNDFIDLSLIDAKIQHFEDELRDPLNTVAPDESTIQTNNLQTKIKLLSRQIRLLRKTQNSSLKEIRRLKETSAIARTKLEKDVRTMERRFRKIEYARETMECKLKTIFTEGQVKQIQNAAKRPKWTEEDIVHALTLYATGAKAYKLLYNRGFPLPGIRTLQDRAKRINISSGIIDSAFQVLSASKHMTTVQKLCVLSFGKMKVQKSYSYCASSDSTLAPANYVQVAMLRGLMSNWKQPVFYEFDCKMTGDLLKYILRRTTSCGCTVAAIVGGLGESNRALYNELEVNEDKPWFTFNNEKIFVFADVPHLIKLQRNHFLDHGFIINGKQVKTDIIFELLKCTSNDPSIAHEISASHLSVSGEQRHKIKMATKLFSNAIAKAIRRAAILGYLSDKNWEECNHIFKVTNDWFDVMSSCVPRADKKSLCSAYGLDIDSQDEALDKMTEVVQNMRVIGKRELLPFQKGIIQSIYALKLMFPDFQSRFRIKYILTDHLNQNILENFFGVMRTKDGIFDHPDRQAFKNRFNAYILGRNKDIISTVENVTDDDISADDNTKTDKKSQPSLTGAIFSSIGTRSEDNDDKEELELEALESDDLETVANYICHKLPEETVEIIGRQGLDHTYSGGVTYISEGDISKPSAEAMDQMAELHKIFDELNEDGILITDNFMKMLMDKAQYVQCSNQLKRLFFRARMHFKLGKLNAEVTENIN